MHIQFYTKKGCHLCDEAEAMMKLVQEDYPLTWSTIDIETDDESHEKYMLMIPVVEKDGEVLLCGSIGYIDLIDLFENE
ncbi:glutaredoxin family protein [Sporosarcina koreensis]|uniref:Glutaredoxin family protein n=1 Tax=Sporosarcina koreensis TaxID=334735 RepID=A0ABW0TTS6_9BACL